jgi:hypothetical protein
MVLIGAGCEGILQKEFAVLISKTVFHEIHSDPI